MASIKANLKTEDKDTKDNSEEVEATEEQPGESEEEIEGEEESGEEEIDESEGEEEESESDEADEEESDGEPEFQKTFTTLKGDTPEEYIVSLEDAYKKSSAEGIRLKQNQDEVQGKLDSLLSVIMTDKDLAAKVEEKLGGDQMKQVTRDPAIDYARSNVEQQWQTEWEDFVGANPELTSDNNLNTKVVNTLKALSTTVANEEKRTLGMAEGLNMVATILGLNQVSKEDKVRMAAKNQAASKTVSGSTKKPKPKSDLTEAQLAFAKRMGYSEEQVRKYAKA